MPTQVVTIATLLGGAWLTCPGPGARPALAGSRKGAESFALMTDDPLIITAFGPFSVERLRQQRRVPRC